MIKTQVQIPDELYRKAKQIAKEREWSLAEVMRRGLEYMTQACPPDVDLEVRLPRLDEKAFGDDFDDLDFRQLSAEDESMRGIGR
jgi:aminoglycoside phosphotransferase